MKEIVLPIKCSTVKKANNTLKLVIAYLAVVAIIVWGVWSFQRACYLNNNTSVVGSYAFWLDTLALCGAVIAIAAVGVLSVKYLPDAYRALPSIGCIKDEEPPVGKGTYFSVKQMSDAMKGDNGKPPEGAVMCSKCNGCLGDTPTVAKELLEESERRRKKRDEKKNPADEFMEGYVR